MEMKEVLSREGRDAKNLLVYQFCGEVPADENGMRDTIASGDKPPALTCRKPPVAPPKSPTSLAPAAIPKNVPSPTSTRHAHMHMQSTGPRVRSASTGRDKKSELQARYWALLFGNLQRAVNEIYQTVECYENISSCQEAILVLENYVRDFKALSEWFKVSWDYESRPVQQRPHSLAWEVRKSNPAPRVRAKSLSSPTTMSGKSSPCTCRCNSGKSSPCCGFDSLGSPRKGVGLRAYETLPRAAMRVNVRELFASSKRQAEPKKEQAERAMPVDDVELELANRRHQFAQTDLEDDHLTLADIREKFRREQEEREREQERDEAEAQAQQEQEQEVQQQEQQQLQRAESFPALQTPTSIALNNEVTEPATPSADIVADVILREPTALEMTVQKLDSMEDALLAKDADKAPTPQTAEVKKIEPVTVPKSQVPPTDATSKKTMPTPVQNGPLKYSSVLNRPAVARGATNTTSSASSAAGNKPNTARVPVASGAVANKAAMLPKSSSNTSLRRSTTISAPVTKALPSRNPLPVRNAPPPRPPSKTEIYGPPTHTASRLSARSRTMIEMNGNKAAPSAKRAPPSANASRKSSREDVGSSSSTLKASNERISSSRSSLTYAPQPAADERHSEPKQLPSADANDGWLTVKNRRRSSMHWANRFNQPTGYASLPTLALLNEKRGSEEEQQRQNGGANRQPRQAKQPQKQPGIAVGAATAAEKSTKVALRPEIRNAKAKVNSLPAQRKISVLNMAAVKAASSNVSSSAPSSARNSVSSVPSRQTIIKRQKSDLTGLKMTSLHKEFMRSEKYAQRKQQSAGATGIRIVASDTKEGVNGTPGVSVDETVGEANNQNASSSTSADAGGPLGDQSKIDIKIQTNRDFSKTIGDLYESISLTAKAATMFSNGAVGDSLGAGKLSSCDENEESLASEMDCDEDQRMLVEEQESLERQIRELESTEIDVDTETDETDGEVVLEHETDDGDEALADQELDDASSIVFVSVNENDSDANLSLELRYQALFSEMSWGEREEALATLQAYVSRHPGRAQELHQKLSSPSRRRSLHETLKKYQAKQARAQQKRELLQKEKAIKIQQLLARVEDVKAAKRQLIEDKRLRMEDKMQRAAENREQHLRQIVEKAHDEEKKLKEINFIKNIEAQNKRLDLIESSKETEGRLQDLEQERQKRLEEKAAKEAAVERRRQELEKERQRKLEKMNETRLEKEQRIGKMQEQKERQRQALAREKARDREERLLALQVQQQQTTEELQRKILQKQKESARRHEENIEHIRQRAVELTIPLRNVDENGLPRAENGEEAVGGEDGDLSSTVSDVGSREHTRSYKKKMKKLKQRMLQSAEEYMKELQPLPLHMKRESQVPKYLNLVAKGGGAQGLERPLGQMLRLMAKAQVFDFQCFLLMDGLTIITSNVITKGMQEDSEVSKKAVVTAVQLYRNACTLCPQIGRHAILGNSLTALFDALFQSLQLPEEKSPQHPVELSTELMLACTVALSPSYTKKHTHPKVLERLPDLISYAVITGLIEILSRRCMKIRESIENHQSVVLSLLATLGFLTRFVDDCPPGPTDTTRFLSAAKSTELFGSISMLYASVVPIGECIPPRTISLSAATFNLLVSMAALDLATFQDVMSSEALSLKFLDVVTILLKYCGNKCSAAKNSETQVVIIDLIATIGFFCANNKKNQDLLTSEQCSIIIKNLTKLPEHLNVVVYPCLVTITFHNQNARNVISRDFNLDLLDEYHKSEQAKKNHLVALLKDKT